MSTYNLYYTLDRKSLKDQIKTNQSYKKPKEPKIIHINLIILITLNIKYTTLNLLFLYHVNHIDKPYKLSNITSILKNII